MNKKVFYRNVLRGLQESPTCVGCDCSPMSSLSNTLFEASLGGTTPCKRLSLSSSGSASPHSIKDTSLSDTNESTHFEKALVSSCEKLSVLSPTTILNSPRNKENSLPTPYYSPSHGQQRPRHHQSPLRELQNTATRNLNFSPLKKPISPSRREHLSPIKNPTPPDDCDSNSRDSGYSESGHKRDWFNVPRAVAPTRRLNLDMSPKFSPSFKSPTEGRKVRSFASLKKKSTDEDEFLMEFICEEEETVEGEGNSSAFESLLSAPIQSCLSPSSGGSAGSCPRLPIRRCLSMIDTSTPLSSRIKSSETSTKKLSSLESFCTAPNSGAPTLVVSSFKRPQSPSNSPNTKDAKRRREESQTKDPPTTPLSSSSSSSSSISTSTATTTITSTQKPSSPKVPLSQRQLSNPEPCSSKDLIRPKIQRCHSESHVSIMKALNNSSNHNGDLTGDFTQPLSLPVISGGKHPDLKSINIDTMSDLLQGKFDDKIASFKVLDCRYPYEYEGGHINTAVNWHHPRMVQEYLDAQSLPPKLGGIDAPRHLLIFHCEFSAERGPRAQRMLREMDRTINKEHYPSLHFPELYLLEGGYKVFFETYPKLCSPNNYVKMLDENHTEDHKFCRLKSKSWTAENKQSRFLLSRTGPKRLGL